MKTWRTATEMLPRAIQVAIASGKPRYIINLGGHAFIVSTIGPHDRVIYTVRPKHLTPRAA